MTNQISFVKIVETVYALSALGVLTRNPDLPGPIGKHEQEALEQLAAKEFRALCSELGREAEIDSVELPGDHSAMLEQIVTDRLLCSLTGRRPDADLVATLKARLRPVRKTGFRF